MADIASAHLAQPGLIQCQQVLPAEQGPPAVNAPGWLRNQAEQAVAGDGFTRARLTDDGRDPARLNRETDVVDRAVLAVAGDKADFQVADLQQRHGGQSREPRTSSASRRPSPRKFRENSVRLRAMPGKISSHGYSSMDSAP